MRSKHTNFKPAFTNETIAQVIHTLSCNVFIYSQLSTRHHVFDCSGKFIDFQQKQNLPLQLIQNFNDFFMILSSFLHYLLLISRRIQVKDISCFVIKLVISLACKHQKKQFWISCSQFSCSCFIMCGIVQDQSQPKLIIVFYKLIVKLLVKAVVKQNKLIFFVIQLPDHQIATMCISVHKALFMDHLYDHIRKQFADFFCVYTHLFQFIDFIDMHTVNILHYQHSLSGFEIQFRDIYIFEVILLQKSLSALHICSFMYEIQLKLQVFLELLDEPFIAKVGEQPQSNIDKFSHHLQIFSNMAHQMSMLNLYGHFLSIQKLCLVNLADRRRRNRLLVEAFEDDLNRISHIFFDCCFYFRKRGNFALSGQS